MPYWNPGRVGQLRELIMQQASAAQIAAELNRGSIEFVTRNAVIGKIHREGWTSIWLRSGHPGPVPGTPAPPRVRPKVKPTPRVNFNGVVKPVTPPSLPPPPRRDRETPRAQRRMMHELNGHTCRWPIGEPGTPSFFFCGAEPQYDRPYCRKHCRVAYRTGARRART